ALDGQPLSHDRRQPLPGDLRVKVRLTHETLGLEIVDGDLARIVRQRLAPPDTISGMSRSKSKYCPNSNLEGSLPIFFTSRAVALIKCIMLIDEFSSAAINAAARATFRMLPPASSNCSARNRKLTSGSR